MKTTVTALNSLSSKSLSVSGQSAQGGLASSASATLSSPRSQGVDLDNNRNTCSTVAQGLHKVARLIAIVMDENDGRVPDIARQVLKVIVNQIEDTQTRIAGLERQVLAWHKNNPVSQRLATIPGIGPIIATAIAATIADPNTFRSGREFAAWLGLVPRQNSTGGKARLGGISKRGDSYLRRLLVKSAHTVLLCSKAAKNDPWLISLLSRKPRLVAAVALANKTARVAWAIMSRHDTYRHVAAAA